MIICSCNRISDHHIRAAVSDILSEDPNALLTPGLVYKKLGFRADCGTCLTIAIETIINEIDHPSHQGCQIIHLSKLQEKITSKRKKTHSRRQRHKVRSVSSGKSLQSLNNAEMIKA